MVLTVADGVRELAALHEEQAKMFEEYGRSEDATMIRRISTDYLRLVEESIPDWVPAAHVAAARGWSKRHVTDLLKSEFEPLGDARKNAAGNWEVRRAAVDRIPAKGQRAGAS